MFDRERERERGFSVDLFSRIVLGDGFRSSEGVIFLALEQHLRSTTTGGGGISFFPSMLPSSKVCCNCFLFELD